MQNYTKKRLIGSGFLKKQFITGVVTIGILTTGFSTSASAHELTYKVKSGDTLWKIATNNNLTVQQLLQYNGLSSSSIYVDEELSLLAPHSHNTNTYTVQSGDSLWGIANAHNTTVSKLKVLNDLSTNTIHVGQVLKVSGTSAVNNSYTVKYGDSLYRIANMYGLSVEQLKSYNNLNSNTIYVGQVLKLSSSSAPASEEKEVDTDSLISEAKKYIGVPYVWGGTSPNGFDCSGFLHYVFLKQGQSIPRTVETIWNAGTSVSSPQKGDLVFFETYKAGSSHAGIYLGNNQFIHAGTSTGVTISDMNNSYWKPRYLGAKSY